MKRAEIIKEVGTEIVNQLDSLNLADEILSDAVVFSALIEISDDDNGDYIVCRRIAVSLEDYADLSSGIGNVTDFDSDYDFC